MLLIRDAIVTNLPDRFQPLAEMLLQSDEDVAYLLQRLTCTTEGFAVFNLRDRHLNQRDYSLEQFGDDYLLDRKTALEHLFIYPLDNEVWQVIEQSIDNLKLTADWIYRQHTLQPKLLPFRVIPTCY